MYRDVHAARLVGCTVARDEADFCAGPDAASRARQPSASSVGAEESLVNGEGSP